MSRKAELERELTERRLIKKREELESTQGGEKLSKSASLDLSESTLSAAPSAVI